MPVQRKFALAAAASAGLFIAYRYLTGATFNNDDLAYLDLLPSVVEQRGYFGTAVMFLFNLDFGPGETRTFGLARAIQLATWAMCGSNSMLIFAFMLTIHAGAALLIPWALRVILPDPAVRWLLALIWFASPFVLPIVRTEHHFLYIIAPYTALVLWTGYAFNVLPRRPWLGFLLLVAVCWLGEAAIPPALVAAGLVTLWYWRGGQRKVAAIVAAQGALAAVLTIAFIVFQRIALTNPALRQRFAVPSLSLSVLTMRLGWFAESIAQTVRAGLGFDYMDPEVGHDGMVRGLDLLQSPMFWVVLSAMLISLKVLCQPISAAKSRVSLVFAALTVASASLYFMNTILAGGAFTIRYTSPIYTLALIALATMAGRRSAVVVASLCLAFTVAAMQRINDLVDAPRIELENRLKAAKNQGKRAVLVKNDGASNLPINNSWPGLGSPYSFVTSDPFKSLWTTTRYLRVVLGFDGVGTTVRETAPGQVELSTDLINQGFRKTYRTDEILVVGTSGPYPSVRPMVIFLPPSTPPP